MDIPDRCSGSSGGSSSRRKRRGRSRRGRRRGREVVRTTTTSTITTTTTTTATTTTTTPPPHSPLQFLLPQFLPEVQSTTHGRHSSVVTCPTVLIPAHKILLATTGDN